MGDLDGPLEYDITELALLLKSIGFQMQSFEFQKSENNKTKDIEIDINCHASGIKTKFILASKKCTCPPKPLENNNTFWEIQARSPSSPAKNIVKDSSCALLPGINKKTAGLARSTLLMLLQHYKNDLNLKAPDTKSALTNNLNELSPTCLSPKKIGSNIGSCRFSTPLTSTDPATQSTQDAQPRPNVPKINIENCEKRSNDGKSDDFASPKFIENLGMSSVIFPSPQINKTDNDRDVYVIESISRARKELDAALLHLKCNITRDISESSILQNATPQTNKSICAAIRNSDGITKRRASLGSNENNHNDVKSKALEQFPFQKPQTKKTPNGAAITSKVNSFSSIKSKLAHPDTPRPQVDLKATVEKGIAKSKMLRSATSSSFKQTPSSVKPSITKQKSALSMKK